MSDEKHLYDVQADPPIPTYEEATSSRPRSRFGPQEVSDDAERQGLLGHDLAPQSSNSRRRNGYYHPPSEQSARESIDEEAGLVSPEGEDGEAQALRQEMEEMEEMDILDPEAEEAGRSRRDRLRGRFSKRFQQITHRLARFHWPRIRIPWPSFRFDWIRDRLPTIPEEYRPGWAILARLCGLILIISLVYLLVVNEIMPMGAGNFGQPFNSEWVRQQVQQNVDVGKIQENLKYITSFPHEAGTQGSYYIGEWIEGKFKEAHMDALAHDDFYVYLNYAKPGGRRVAIVHPPEKAWVAKLEEESAYNPPRQQTGSFHGFSASGNVTGPLIYANYGHTNDFRKLKDAGIDVKGAVVLMRYYGTQSDRSMKVRTAEEAGAAGVLIYSDPADDGSQRGDVWPLGRWRPEDSVQRGTVALTSWIAGDPLTPGLPSTKDAKRMPKDKNPALPRIPSLPLAWRDAQKLIQALSGIGVEAPKNWRGGDTPKNGDQPWFTGHQDSSPQVNLQNFQDENEKQPIRNVFGSFIGMEEKAKKIIIGNHRDSWCFGAADPGSGTAVMLEVARLLGELRMQGWRPLRTIEFASWDAEEYNIIGSTEHVEANMDDLRANAVAYLNVDVGVTGSKLWANGSPVFQNAWLRVLNRVADPIKNVTLKELWVSQNTQVGGLGAGSDYVAFQDFAGCSSFDFGFAGEEHGDMYHSCYETFEWVSKYIDPGFAYHGILAQVWALLILELAQEPIVPFKIDDYANWLMREAHALIDWARSQFEAQKQSSRFDAKIFQQLTDAIHVLKDKALKFHLFHDFWYNSVYTTGGFESPGLTMQRTGHNGAMAAFDTWLLDLPEGDKDKEPHGIPGRDQYKHVVFGPDASGSGYDAAIFPFVRDAIDNGDWALAEKQIKKTADIIRKAAEKLLK